MIPFHSVSAAHTANHSLDEGFETLIVEDACRGVSDVGMAKARKTLLERGAVFVSSSEVILRIEWQTQPKIEQPLNNWSFFQMSGLASGKTRRVELCRFLAERYATKYRSKASKN